MIRPWRRPAARWGSARISSARAKSSSSSERENCCDSRTCRRRVPIAMKNLLPGLAGPDLKDRVECSSELWAELRTYVRFLWTIATSPRLRGAREPTGRLSSPGMGIDTRALDAGQPYLFQLRLTLGTIAPVAPPLSVCELETTVRGAGETLARRAEHVAGVLHHLAERGWLPLNSVPAGREVLTGHGFAGPEGATLPEAVSIMKDATPSEVASDLAGAGDEVVVSLTVRLDDLDLPVVLTAD